MTKVRNFIFNPYLIIVFRLILGITFIYASFYKVLEPSEFARSIYNYRILPIFMINIMAVILPWIELVCGVFLVLGILTRENVLILTVLLLVFSFAVGSVIIRGIDVECGCFKQSAESQRLSNMDKGNRVFTERVDLFLLGRDLALLCMALLILFSQVSPFEFDYYLFEHGQMQREVIKV